MLCKTIIYLQQLHPARCSISVQILKSVQSQPYESCTGHGIMERNKSKPQKSKLSFFIDSYEEFAKNTYNHGFIYTASEKIYGRFFWTLVICFGLCATFFLINAFWMRYIGLPLRLNVASSTMSTSKFAFPAITLCNKNFAYEGNLRALSSVLAYNSPLGQEAAEQNIRRSLRALSSKQFWLVSNDSLDFLAEAAERNKEDLNTIMDKLGQSCDDMLMRCRLEGLERNCSELFVRSVTPYGHCCSFNSHIQSRYIGSQNVNGSKYYRSQFFGLQTGLSVVVKRKKEPVRISNEYSDKIEMRVHNVSTYPSDSVMSKIIPFGKETMVQIIPSYIFSSPEVRDFPADDRNCLFSDENHLKWFNRYIRKNCFTECAMRRYRQLCKCIPFYFYSISNRNMCPVAKVPCVLKYSKMVWTRTGKAVNEKQLGECNCPPECEECLFTGRTTNGDLNATMFSLDPFYRKVKTNDDYLVLHIFYGKQGCRVWRRVMLSTWIDLTTSIGGIVGLCLGSSLLSILEIFYYALRFVHKTVDTVATKTLKNKVRDGRTKDDLLTETYKKRYRLYSYHN